LNLLNSSDKIEFNKEESKSIFSFMNQGNNEAIDYPGLKDRNLTWLKIIQMYVEPDKFFDKCFT